MATIQKLEDIEVWQLARIYTKEIKELTDSDAYKFEFGLKNQLKDAAGSIMDNIAEGFGRGSKNEFVNFLSYAKGSAEETKSQLYRSLDFKLITEHVFKTFYDKVVAIIKKITSFMNYLNASLVGGQKFKGRKKN